MRLPWRSGRHQFTRRTARQDARRVDETPEAEAAWIAYKAIKTEHGSDSTLTWDALLKYQEEALPWRP